MFGHRFARGMKGWRLIHCHPPITPQARSVVSWVMIQSTVIEMRKPSKTISNHENRKKASPENHTKRIDQHFQCDNWYSLHVFVWKVSLLGLLDVSARHLELVSLGTKWNSMKWDFICNKFNCPATPFRTVVVVVSYKYWVQLLRARNAFAVSWVEVARSKTENSTMWNVVPETEKERK